MTLRQHSLAAGALLMAVLVIYLPHILQASFVYEDARYLAGVDAGVAWSRVLSGRGLTQQSWALIATPVASHAFNLGLHTLVIILTGVLLWNLTASSTIAWGVAAMVALHPAAVEGVAYAASRADLVSAVGVLAALVCLTARSPWWGALVPACAALAYSGKETGAIVIALVPLVLWLQGEQVWAARLTAGLCGAGVLLVGWRFEWVRHLATSAQYAYVSSDAASWLLVQAVAVWRLVVLSAIPVGLVVSPDLVGVTPLAGGCAALLLVASLETAWHLRDTSPLITFGIVWCALVAAPRFLVRTPTSPMNEHQWYLALVGVGSVLVGLYQRLPLRLPLWREAWA